ncbi:carbon-nitrogen hydrolase [Aspergillus spinulosporus]
MHKQLLSLICLLAGTTATPINTSLPVLHAALVRAPPALWSEPILSRDYHGVDINATTTLGVKYIERAASEGANLVAFPELWFPGYPRGNNATWIKKWAKQYVANSITRGDHNWNRLVTAAKRNAVYVALGYSEREGDYIYMAQTLIDPEGEVLIHRHKLRPSGQERDFWSDGTMDELKVVETPFGRVGLLECWEHFHPSMTFPMQAQAEEIHIGAFPYMPDYGAAGTESWETAEVNMAAASVYATNSGAYTFIPTVGRAAAFYPTGLEMAYISANASYTEHPYLLVSVNTTGFAGFQPSLVEGEQSWGVLEQIRNGWPEDVPKVIGEFTKQVLNSVNDL